MSDYARIFAELVIRIGVRLAERQSLIIKTGPDTYAFARLAAQAAYRAGAAYVHIDLQDQILLNSRINAQNIEQLRFVPCFIEQMHQEALRNDWAYLRIDNTEDRDELKHADPEKVRISGSSLRERMTAFYASLMRHEHPWCVICVPGPRWAEKILGKGATAEDLWNVTAPILKLDREDPVKAWEEWDIEHTRKRQLLDSLNIDSLHIKDELTDLHIGLAQRARWLGGSDELPDGRKFFPNLPTEELFSLPDYRRVSGTVATTRPVTVYGQQVNGAVITIENGSAVAATADSGEAILKQFFDTDQGARRLGEIALVDELSPLAKSGLQFHSILYDENASSHIAFGSGYPSCLADAKELESDEQLLERGCNISLVHVDFMIGSPNTVVTALLKDGSSRKIMERGKFVL